MKKMEMRSKVIKKPNPIRICWENHQWFVIIIGVIVVFALGAAGYAEYYSRTSKSANFLDVLYRIFQLFVLGFDISISDLNWELEIARWLAPVIAAYTAIRALAVIFSEQLQLFRVQFLRKHIIICGLGRKGLLLARRLKEDGYKVVVIENNENNDKLEQCRDSGAIVLVGNAMDPNLLNKARLKKAKYLFCICGDDGANAGIAYNARKLLPVKRSQPLTCIIHIIDPQLCRLLKEQEFTTEANDAFRQEFFNLYDFAARSIMETSPPFKYVEEKIKTLPHLLIVGLGNMGENLAVHAARKWLDLAGNSGKKLKISIVDTMAKQKRDLLNRRYPRLSKVWKLDPLQMDIASENFEEGRFLFNLRKTCKISIIYVCLDDDSFALRAALCLHQVLRDHNIPIVVRMDRETGLAPLIEGDTHGFANIQVFGFLDRVLKPELLFTGTHEILARAIHEEYRRDRLEKEETIESNPSLVSWENLPETLKNSNRRQADYMGVKLKTIGCYIVPMTDWNAHPVKFTSDEIEDMAIIEHEHWMDERLKDGWKYGPEKDIDKKISPVLIPWGDLPENEKEKDRNPVREMPNFLARAGFQIYRRSGKSSSK